MPTSPYQKFADKNTEKLANDQEVLEYKNIQVFARKKLELLLSSHSLKDLHLTPGIRLEKLINMIKAMVNNHKLKPIHPGDILKTEFLEPLKLSEKELAQNIQVKEQTISELLAEKSRITPELAYRLSCYFQVSPELFLNLQQRYDLKVLEQEKGEQIKQNIKPYPRKESARVNN